MTYRKVAPQDEIPTRMLTPAAQERRIVKAQSGASRKAAKHLGRALDAFSKSEHLTTEVMEEFYRELDKYLAEAIAPLSVCAKGCAQCCHVPVQVPYPEALYISEKTGRPLNYRGMLPLDKLNTRCPFLDDNNLCSIREYRPMVCRLFHTVDHWQYCINNERHFIFGLRSLPPMIKVHELLSSVKDEGNIGYADIREWFQD